MVDLKFELKKVFQKNSKKVQIHKYETAPNFMQVPKAKTWHRSV